jgi:hypothetical protein
LNDLHFKAFIFLQHLSAFCKRYQNRYQIIVSKKKFSKCAQVERKVI